MLAWGYVLGLVALVWFAVDSGRIPALVWFWSGYSRAGWWTAMVACFIAGGVPAFVAVLVWRFGNTRKGLKHEVADLRGSNRSRAARVQGTAGGIA